MYMHRPLVPELSFSAPVCSSHGTTPCYQPYPHITSPYQHQANLGRLGVVKSHKGVIGILLDYIPHSHRSLRTLLRGVRNGTTPGHAASLPRRLRWAEQIRHTVTRLHELGVIWGCAKLDNVLIDNQGNAVALSLGGGNTTGGKDRGEEDVRGREAQGLLRGVSDALVLPN
jgi:serine/threonine protein kinase